MFFIRGNFDDVRGEFVQVVRCDAGLVPIVKVFDFIVQLFEWD
jgi:hypothetical protein